MDTSSIIIFNRLLKKKNTSKKVLSPKTKEPTKTSLKHTFWKKSFNWFLLVILFFLGVYVYANFMRICHHKEIIVVRNYGQTEIFCDSIKLNLAVLLPRFDTSNIKYPNTFSYYTICPRNQYYHNGYNVDSLHWVYDKSGRAIWIDTISLSADEIQNIQKIYNNRIPDSICKTMKGALGLQFFYSKDFDDEMALTLRKVKEISSLNKKKEKKYKKKIDTCSVVTKKIHGDFQPLFTSTNQPSFNSDTVKNGIFPM